MPKDFRGHECTDHDIHSGVYECQKCWYWRKLDGPAARHWLKASTEFLSNVDTYDYITFFPNRVGMSQDDFAELISRVAEVMQKCEAMIKEHE